MKRVISALALVAFVAVTAPAMANPITITSPGTHFGADVGSIDALVDFGTLENSGDQTVINFVNDRTGNAYTTGDFDKFCDGSGACGNMLLITNTQGVYAVYLDTAPAYFLVKTGKGKGNGSTLIQPNAPYACGSGNTRCDNFLFTNGGNTSYLVFRMSDMGFAANATGKISHMDSFGMDPDVTAVPEPGVLGMFGAGMGLIGLFFGLRRRQRQ